MDRIALGFSNTVDYEIEWDAPHLEGLIRRTGLHSEEIREIWHIRDMKDLLSSILFHMREGTGCGLMTEVPLVIDEYIKGTKYRVALGGTNLRAAEVISALGGSALIHLVSVNSDTIERMPPNVSWTGGEKFHCCFPHIAIQFPAGVAVRADDIEITAAKENRVIYSGDIACAQMPLEDDFFARASKAQVMLLSGFDLIIDPQVLEERLHEAAAKLSAFGDGKPLIFYEHGCFADRDCGEMLWNILGPVIDIASMNEDEFQALAGRRIDLLDEEKVRDALLAVHEKLPDMTLVVHTCRWALAFGERSADIIGAVENGILAASTRYRKGYVDETGIAETRKLPLQNKAKEFSRKLEASMGNHVKCLPVAEIHIENPTTIGLGDSFAGGFLYKYCSDHTMREA